MYTLSLLLSLNSKHQFNLPLGTSFTANRHDNTELINNLSKQTGITKLPFTNTSTAQTGM